jgi:IS30 family transposase
MGTRYTQLSLEERCTIARLYEEGQSLRKIASTLDRSPSTLSREIKRNSGSRIGYKPVYADEQSWARRWCGSRLERQPALRTVVLDRLAMGWSPEQIAGRLAREERKAVISHESIYRFIYAQIRKSDDFSWRLFLPRAKFKRGYRGRKGGSAVKTFKHRISIEQRPLHVQERKETGHWEADLLLFSNKKDNLMVMQERASRYVLLTLQSDKKAEAVVRHQIQCLSTLPRSLRKTLTQDNGTEFAFHYRLETCAIDTYFCNPHSPWQKGGVENMNGRLRRYLPRKTNIDTLTQKDILSLQNRMNHTPRKCLDFYTPAEIINKVLHFKCESTCQPSLA